MSHKSLEGLFRLHSYREEPEEAARSPFTVAVSRQPGSRGAEIARLVGQRLGWPVYDRELLQTIGAKTGWRMHLLEDIDERRVSWMEAALSSFAAAPGVSSSAYVRRLVETITALATKGACVIVGRGAAQILPPATTLRVRVVGDHADRVASIAGQRQLTPVEAERWVNDTERERLDFVRTHFLKDPAEPTAHDLVLNSSRFSPEECAELIVEALKRMQVRLASPAVAVAGH